MLDTVGLVQINSHTDVRALSFHSATRWSTIRPRGNPKPISAWSAASPLDPRPGCRDPRRLARRIAVVILIWCGVPAAALGESVFNASLTLTSDFFWRGYSKSDDGPSLQANAEYSSNIAGSGYFLGAWVAEVDFTDGDRADASRWELVPYFGWSQAVADDYRLDVQLSRYIYDERIFGKGADYYELYVFAHYRDIVTAEFAYAPDSYDIGEDTFNYQLIGRYPLLAMLEVSAGVGFFRAVDLYEYDYWYWNLGVTWHIEHFAVDVRYFGSAEVNEKHLERSFWVRELPFEKAEMILTISLGF